MWCIKDLDEEDDDAENPYDPKNVSGIWKEDR